MITLLASALKLNILTFGLAPGAACKSSDVSSGGFFLIPHWWEYIKSFKVDELGQCMPSYTFPGDVWGIGFAIIDILLRIAGVLAVFAVILAGIHYIIAVGNPEKTRSARRSLINALVGLTIAMVAIGIVKFIGTKIVG